MKETYRHEDLRRKFLPTVVRLEDKSRNLWIRVCLMIFLALIVTNCTNPLLGEIQAIVASYVQTLAGSAGQQGSVDGSGSDSRFDWPLGIVSSGSNLFVADAKNNIIRKIAIDGGTVTTIAGSANGKGSADGSGANARFDLPTGITTDGTSLYVTDTTNDTIRVVSINGGNVVTLAGAAGYIGNADGTGQAARFGEPFGIAINGTSLFVTDTLEDTVRRIAIATGAVTTLAGIAGSPGSTDGTGTVAQFDQPEGVATDGTNLYVCDTGNNTIRKIVIATAGVTTLAGTPGYVGSVDARGRDARFNRPVGIAINGSYLYVTDSGNNTIRRVTVATGDVTTVAGIIGTTGSSDGPGSRAQFDWPTGIVWDSGSIYVTDTNNSTVRVVTGKSLTN